jgi:TM2 domain-containing membrane protein YozV
MNCVNHSETPASVYCRTCGKAMCDTCKRDVMGAIYCETCLAARLHGGVATAPGMQPAVVVPSAPNPGVAAMLGFIPGVGAMYNGQFVRAFAHVVIFVMIIMATDQISGFIGFGIPVFIIYMVIDAHQSAKARQLGLPAPDPLGLDRLFGSQSTPAPATTMAVTDDTAVAVPPSNSLPVGAIVLIGLGVLFLLANFGVLHFFHIVKFWPLIFIALGLWIAFQRTTAKA